jgi:hypothetical protein
MQITVALRQHVEVCVQIHTQKLTYYVLSQVNGEEEAPCIRLFVELQLPLERKRGSFQIVIKASPCHLHSQTTSLPRHLTCGRLTPSDLFRLFSASLWSLVDTMHEIVTLQFGQQSNYLGTHFWNTQVGS